MIITYHIYQRSLDWKKLIHETIGHLSSDAVFDSLRTRYWWPQQLQSLKDYQQSCENCQLNRSNQSVDVPHAKLTLYGIHHRLPGDILPNAVPYKLSKTEEYTLIQTLKEGMVSGKIE